ncbi:MAG: hypothetical protein ACREOZ_04000 [Gloeomargaritales cyanobacterium]
MTFDEALDNVESTPCQTLVRGKELEKDLKIGCCNGADLSKESAANDVASVGVFCEVQSGIASHAAVHPNGADERKAWLRVQFSLFEELGGNEVKHFEKLET